MPTQDADRLKTLEEIVAADERAYALTRAAFCDDDLTIGRRLALSEEADAVRDRVAGLLWDAGVALVSEARVELARLKTHAAA